MEYIIGDAERLDRISEVRAWKPFDERIVDFCNVLSGLLLKNPKTTKYPDLITLAFWLRKSNIKSIKNDYEDFSDRLGRGLTFHIAPGNVALSFAYSLFTGLLTGNTNVVRLPSRHFEQADIFCKILQDVLAENVAVSERICLIRYPHDKAVTDELSLKCHTRIIWGGDDTVSTIRMSPIMPRTTEITFANRFSICVINADQYLSNYDPKKTAHAFYIDTFLTDQNACSSPRIVFWMGYEIIRAQEVSWEALYDEIKEYNIAPVTTVDKLLTFCKFASDNKCKMTMVHDCRIMRVQIPFVTETILDNIGNSGYFYECNISSIDEILPICRWSLQTVSFIGFNENDIHEMIMNEAPDGVDRIVPVGRTMDFSFIWDGRDVIREMTRKVSLLSGVKL